MKFILFFWLAGGTTPITMQLGDPMACVLALDKLQGQFEKSNGICLPYSYKSDKQYLKDFKATNSSFPR